MTQWVKGVGRRYCDLEIMIFGGGTGKVCKERCDEKERLGSMHHSPFLLSESLITHATLGRSENAETSYL